MSHFSSCPAASIDEGHSWKFFNSHNSDTASVWDCFQIDSLSTLPLSAIRTTNDVRVRQGPAWGSPTLGIAGNANWFVSCCRIDRGFEPDLQDCAVPPQFGSCGNEC